MTGTGPSERFRSRGIARRSSTLLLALGTAGALLGCGQTDLAATTRLDSGDPARVPLDSDGSGTDSSEDGESAADPVPTTPTLTVSDGKLRDHCGEPLVFRGANEMVVWSDDRDGVPEFFEMAKSGVNAVRVVWLTTVAASELGVALRNARQEGLAAVVECHDDIWDEPEATGLDRVLDYWTSDEALSVLAEHEESVVLEISPRTNSSSPEEWEALYVEAIGRLRDAGIRVPVAIEMPDWGDDDVPALGRHSSVVVGSDPSGRTLLSLEMWNGTVEGLRAQAEELQQRSVPFYLSEFSGYQASGCPDEPMDVAGILELAAEFGFGWFAWSWGGVANSGCDGNFDMSTEGTLESLRGWGLTVVQEDPHSIARTAIPLETLGLEQCPIE